MSKDLEYVRAFLRGEIEPFDEPLEDCDAFHELSESDLNRKIDLESAVMALAHGDCHILTVGLAEAVGVEEVIVLRDRAGMPVHSGLYHAERQLLLDANGVHRIADAEEFWSSLARSHCSAKPMSLEDLCFFVSPGVDELEWARENFAMIVEFIRSLEGSAEVEMLDSPSL